MTKNIIGCSALVSEEQSLPKNQNAEKVKMDMPRNVEDNTTFYVNQTTQLTTTQLTTTQLTTTQHTI